MSQWTPVSHCYDGSFAGFLSCVFDSYLYKEEPLHFSAPGQLQYSLYPPRDVSTLPEHAKRVFLSLGKKISGDARMLVRLGFLTCLPQRERHLYEFIRLGYQVGASVTRNLTNPQVAILQQAVGHLNGEVHLLKGFVRFSQYPGLLAGVISPKNQVLPLLRTHFCNRLSGESFLLYDSTHKQALFHIPGKWSIAPVEEFTLGAPEQEELAYRQLWRRFYDTIAIESRYNPKLRRNNMPKRYWDNMTEFQTDPPAETPALPGS